MFKLKFAYEEKSPLNVLCLGAHSDDIEIGCGGTGSQNDRELWKYIVPLVVFSSNEGEKKRGWGERQDIFGGRREKEIIIKTSRWFFPYVGGKIKEYFEELKGKINPDLVFTHYRSDLHQDHRLISDPNMEYI